MSEFKMSELFDLPVDSCICFSDCTAVTVTYSEVTNEQIKAIDHAINNHDRLVQERDELINALEQVIANWQVDASLLCHLCHGAYSDYIKDSKMVDNLIAKIQVGE